MNLSDIIHRDPHPQPWAEGEKIPWNEPEFSRRMLAEHLSQAHDMASRRSTIIDQHVAWINQVILQGKPANILDLGCGPGLYSNRLAALGHTCTGIDFSPASILYARENSHPNARYIEGDVRQVDYGQGYGLVLFIFGEINVFTPQDARLILEKAHAALVPGGILLLEPHTFDCVQRLGKEPATWYSAAQGVFSDGPFLCLMEYFWDEGQRVAIERFYVIEEETGAVSRYTQSIQAYADEEYVKMLRDRGYTDIRNYSSLTGEAGETSNDLLVIAARKPDLNP
jgi:SAM-dependent methyltransferase